VRSSGRAASVLAALLAWVTRTEASEPVRFEYSAPGGCPDHSVFAERVRARVQRGRFAAEGELARVFTISVTSSGATSTAKVEFVDSNGERVVRAVSGETCDEVVSGIALVTALAIDARAGADEEPAAGPEPEARGAPSEPPLTAKLAVAPKRASAEPPPALRWELGVTGSANTWSAPEAAFGAGVFGEVDLGAFPLRHVRVSLLRATSSAFVGTRKVRFTSSLVRLSACPVALELVDHLALVPCLGADFGALEGEGTMSASLPNPDADTIFLPVGLLFAEIRYDLDDILVFEGRGELGFPLRRRTFKFDDQDQPVFDLPEMGFGAGVSVGLRFP